MTTVAELAKYLDADAKRALAKAQLADTVFAELLKRIEPLRFGRSREGRRMKQETLRMLRRQAACIADTKLREQEALELFDPTI